MTGLAEALPSCGGKQMYRFLFGNEARPRLGLACAGCRQSYNNWNAAGRAVKQAVWPEFFDKFGFEGEAAGCGGGRRDVLEVFASDANFDVVPFLRIEISGVEG